MIAFPDYKWRATMNNKQFEKSLEITWKKNCIRSLVFWWNQTSCKSLCWWFLKSKNHPKLDQAIKFLSTWLHQTLIDINYFQSANIRGRKNLLTLKFLDRNLKCIISYFDGHEPSNRSIKWEFKLSASFLKTFQAL